MSIFNFLKYLVFFLILSYNSYSQSSSEEYLYLTVYPNGNFKETIKEIDSLYQIISYFKSGQIKDSLVRKEEINVGIRKVYYHSGSIKNIIDYGKSGADTSKIKFIEYHKNGLMKDSATLINTTPIGERKIFHKNGNTKFLLNYKKEDGRVQFIKYRKDGTLFATGGRLNNRAFGEHKKYNRKGEVIAFKDLHKRNTVVVPNSYRKGSHLKETEISNRIEYYKVVLENDNKQKKIKSGALISIETIKDSTTLFHCQIEGFSKDSIIISKFNYDLTDSKFFLEYDSTFVLAFNDISNIHFSKNKQRLGEFAAATINITSTILITHPILLPAIFSGFAAIIEPTGLIMLSSSIPLSLWGNYLNRKMVPKKYDLLEWKITY